MVKELILHLGDCKTGSTALQMALAYRTVQITGHSLYYPPGANHNALARTISTNRQGVTREAQLERANRAFGDMAALIDASDADFGIISAELFEYSDPKLLAQMLNTHFSNHTQTMRMIVYIRPHADRLLSWFAEVSKLGGWQGDMDGFLTRLQDRGTLDYMPRLTRWRDLFGDRLIVRPFVRDNLKNGDIVTDVLHIIGRGAPVVVPATHAQNPSLSLQDIVMLRVILKRIGAQGRKQATACKVLGREMGRLLSPLATEQSTKLRLHRQLAQQVALIYTADAAAIDSAFFDGTPLQAALQSTPKKAADTPQDLSPAAHFSAEQQRHFEAWGDMMGRIITADPVHAAWAFKSPKSRAPAPSKLRSPTPPVYTRPAWRRVVSRLRAHLTR